MYKIIISFFVFLSLSFVSFSQCSMCRAVAESSQAQGSGIANSLNTGILYLMAFPYLLLLFGLISIYFRSNKTWLIY